MFDIDHFKHINDRYGHAAGDAVLVEFVRRVQECLPREIDWCARLGGEEFAVVLPQTDLDGAAVVAEKIRRAVAASPVLTATGGIECHGERGRQRARGVCGSRRGVPSSRCCSRADDCLYTSKNAGPRPRHHRRIAREGAVMSASR